MKQQIENRDTSDPFELANQAHELSQDDASQQDENHNFRRSQHVNSHRQHIFDKTRPSETPSLVDLRSFQHREIAIEVINHQIQKVHNHNSQVDIQLKQISLENEKKMSKVSKEKDDSMKQLKNLEQLKNKIRVMDHKQKKKLKKMAMAGEKAEKAFKHILQKGMDQEKKDKFFDKKLRRQIKLRKQVVEVREDMREKLIASRRNQILKNRKVKRKLDKELSRKLKEKQEEIEMVNQGKQYRKMMVLLSRQKAKFNVNQIQKMKKLKVNRILQQEKDQQDAQKRKIQKLWRKRLDFMHGIEQRIDSANVMTEQYEKLYSSLVKDKNTSNLEELMNDENMSFGEHLSRKISKTLDRPSTGSVLTTRRSQKNSSRIYRGKKIKGNDTIKEKPKEKFKSFQHPPKERYKPQEPLMYSRKRAISQQYKDIKKKYYNYKRKNSYQGAQNNRNSQSRKRRSSQRNHAQSSYDRHRTDKVNRVYQNANNHKKLHSMLRNLQEKENERKFDKRQQRAEYKRKFYHSLNSGKTPGSKKPILKKIPAKKAKKEDKEQENDINNSYKNSGGYGSFGADGFFITDPVHNPRTKFNSDVVNDMELDVSKDNISKTSKGLKKHVTIDDNH